MSIRVLVRVADRAQAARRPPPRTADVGDARQVGAPMPGIVTTVSVLPGQKVVRGDVLLTIEAMKMETAVRTERDGEIAEVLVTPKQRVDVKELLVLYR